MREFRKRKLASLLEYCYRNVPYYREKFRDIGATPQDFGNPEDLSQFPLLEKETLRDRPEEFFDPKADRSSWISYRSSGSTGIPLELWYHPAERQQMGFTMTREFLFHGLKPWHRMVNVTEPRHASPKNQWYHRLGLMNEKFLSVYDPPEPNLARLLEIRPHLLIGFPSVLMLIGQCMMKDGGEVLRPRMLFTLAEVLSPDDRALLTKQWGVEPVDVYGCNEAGHIAFQCSRREGYHINLDSLNVELVAGGKPVEAGERGEVVVTNFDLRVMPIIRYRVGDVAQSLESDCSCGCRFPMLGRIAGRSDGFLVGADGRLFSALEVALFLNKLQGVNQYRLVQQERGAISVEYTATGDGVVPDVEIRNLLYQHLGAGMAVEIRRVAEIPREKSGKIRTVVSRLPHPFR
jgi:phenylacetate-CoA ligase